jgi:hypothetical protein
LLASGNIALSCYSRYYVFADMSVDALPVAFLFILTIIVRGLVHKKKKKNCANLAHPFGNLKYLVF